MSDDSTTKAVSRAKDFWKSSSYSNETAVVERFIELGDIRGYYPEVLEWHSVDVMMAEWLEEKDETVISFLDKYYWGRKTTGQSVWQDHVIKQIRDEVVGQF